MPETSYQSLFMLLNMFSDFLVLVIYHMAYSDALIKRNFSVILKITVSNLRKPLHNIVIIQFLTCSLGLKTIRKYVNISKTKRAF